MTLLNPLPFLPATNLQDSHGMPDLIFLSDGWPGANMAGISQTLYNLFERYAGKLWMLIPELESIPVGSRLEMSEVRYPVRPFAPITNRIGRWLNNGRLNKQLAYRQNHWQAPIALPSQEHSLVIVSTTDATKLQLAWLLLRKGYTVIPYFMDDWLAGNELKWKGGNIQQVAMDLLAQAPAWLMISESLNRILKERYQLKQKPYLVVHNPSPNHPTTTITAYTPSTHNKHFQLIYAGSIWPMHADALIAVAKAIHHLHATGAQGFGLTIHCSDRHWKQYEKNLRGPGVKYGGWIKYEKLPEKFEEGSLLLCTASFDASHQAFSVSSVQTKLTDYMASGKPVLFVGPADAASGRFVEEWDCGFTVGTSEPGEIAAQIKAIASLPALWQRKSANALLHAQTTFSKPLVQQKLYKFLADFSLRCQ